MTPQVREALPLLVPVLVVATWLALVVMLARYGGWKRLAERYRALGPFRGKVWRFRSGRLNRANYNTCLTVGTDGERLYLAPLFVYRPGHPPLLIPWKEITAEKKKILFMHYVDLSFSRVPGSRLRISERLWRRIAPDASAPAPPDSRPPKIEPR